MALVNLDRFSFSNGASLIQAARDYFLPEQEQAANDDVPQAERENSTGETKSSEQSRGEEAGKNNVLTAEENDESDMLSKMRAALYED